MADQPTATAPAPVDGKPAGAASVAEPPKSAGQEDLLKPRFEELTRQQKKIATERAAFSKERQAHAEAVKKAQEWEARHADRLRNPAKYLEADFGPDWSDKLTRLKVEGIPPADMVASEVQALKSELQKQLEEERAKVTEMLTERQRAEAVAARDTFLADAVKFTKDNAGKFQLINDWGEHEAVKNIIDEHFRSTSGVDELTGEARPGEVLTHQAAAEELEKRLKALEDKFDSVRAERAKRNDPTAAPGSTQRNQPTQRRTLSTDMTARSAGTERPPPKDDNERLRNAIAAWSAAEGHA